MFETEHSRWQAVQSRSKSADSAFVYAVTTTRICCRPTCPARLARRANVRFYDSSKQAVAAGFRPCKRCKPDQAHLDDSDGAASQKLAVQKACSYIEARGGATTLKDIAKHTGISARYLHGIFKDITGTTPAAYAARFKTSANTPATSQGSVPQTPNSGYFGYRPDAVIGDSAVAIDDVDLDYYTTAASYAAAEGQLKTVCEVPEDLGWTFDVDMPSVWDNSYSEISGYCTDVDFVESSTTPPDLPSFAMMAPDGVFLDPEFNWSECWPDVGMDQPVLA